MCQLLESLRVENKKLHHTGLHNMRFNLARKTLFGKTDFIHLEDHIIIPNYITDQRYKCRIVTNGEKIETEITPYVQREVKSLKVIHINKIDYSYKFLDRNQLDKAFEARGECDDIIIIKNNMVSDAWAANLIFFDGENWVTPNTPLLKGIQREYLLSTGKISEQAIPVSEIMNYKKIRLINAMIDLEHAPEIDIVSGVIY
jgi:4-amino-4-deoxychorismate lyase